MTIKFNETSPEKIFFVPKNVFRADDIRSKVIEADQRFRKMIKLPIIALIRFFVYLINLYKDSGVGRIYVQACLYCAVA